MTTIGVFFAEGFEEIEGLTVVDLARRADIRTVTISVGKEKAVTGSHGITVLMDQLISETDFTELDMIVLPGGAAGTERLEACGTLMEQLDRFYEDENKYIAAVCAAPSILGHRGYLNGRRATSYPTFESQLEGAEVTTDPVVRDGRIITGRGMGCSIAFGLEIVSVLKGTETAEKLAHTIVYNG